MTKKNRVVISSLLFVIFILLLIITLPNRERLTFLFINTTYYFLLILVLMWVYQISRYLISKSFSFKNFFFKNYKGIISAIILTGIIGASIPSNFRTLSDETNLLATSKSMYFDKTVYNVTEGKYYYNNFNSIVKRIPKRPLMFQFFTNIIHVILGYRYQNPFLLNLFVLFSLLLGVYLVTKNFLNEICSIAAMILTVSNPIVSICGTSAGFDLFSTFFFFLTFVSLFIFIKEKNKKSFFLLLVNLLILINIRYESIIYFLIIMIALLLFKYLKLEYIYSRIIFVSLSLLSFLPMIWQRILSHGQYENYGKKLFGVENFNEHLLNFFKSIFDFSFSLPYANILTILAIPCVLYIFYHLFIKNCSYKKSLKLVSDIQLFTILVTVSIFIGMIVYLSHHFGWYSHPTQSRFFLIFSISCALLPIVVKVINPKIISSKILLVFACVVFVLYHPIAAEGRFINQLILTREYNWSRKYIEEMNDKNILIISNRPGQFTALNYGAISISNAERDSKQLLRELDRGLFSNIIVLQRIKYSDKNKDELSKKFNLITLKTYQIKGDAYLRISKVSP
jgi:hypothetical protein